MVDIKPSFVACLAFLVSACASPPAKAPGRDAATLPIATTPDAPIATKGNCTEPALAPAALRDKGIDAFVEGREAVAIELLTAAVKTDPRDRTAEAFLGASRAKLEESQARAADALASLPRVSLAPIPLAYTLRRNVDGAPNAKVHLEKQSEAKNLITDFEDWETKNELRSVGRRGRTVTRLANVPKTMNGAGLRNAFVHADHVAAIYGSSIVISSEGKRPLVFDARAAMSRAPRPFDLAFAQLVGGTLVVELAYNGYANESGGKNGYFAAFDAASGELSWVTDPLVANAGEAVVSGGSIVTGYGFTAEPDFLFVLDLTTGKVEQKIPVKSGPEAIRAKGDQVFVRSYDVDYVFKSTTGLAPAPAAKLSPGPDDSPPAPDAETRCWVRRAAASIAAKDVDGLREAAARLKPLSRDRVLDDLLQTQTQKLTTESGLDLAAAPIVVVPSPPWQATPPAGGATQAPKLVKVSSKAASPIRNMKRTFDPTLPFFIAPIEAGKLPDGARTDIPRSYGQEHLGAIIPDERQNERLILLYGGRYLALVQGDKAERVFDLESFRHPPKANPQWKEFATQDATYAQERDNVLYVCNGGGSYAKEVFGKKGFISAIDATTGKLLWRSAPLTCNATFAVAGDHLVTGYGFTDEPDFVFVIRRSDGAVVQKVAIPSGPDTITLSGNRVHVETYDSVVDLELR